MKKRKHIEINYIEDLGLSSRIHIAFDFNSIVFLNGQENFMLNKFQNEFMKTNLNHLMGRTIKFCKSFPEEHGIYFVTCDKYNKDIYIMSSEA